LTKVVHAMLEKVLQLCSRICYALIEA